MTTQYVSAIFQTNDGRTLTFNDTATDGTVLTLQTGGANQNIASDVNFGQIGEGLTFVKGCVVASVQAPVYAYIESQGGKVLQPLPVGLANQGKMQDLCAPIRAQTGMTIKVLTQVTSGTLAGVGLYGPNGADVFTATYSNGNEVQFSSVLTGLTVGQALAGARINKAICSVSLTGFANTAAGAFPFVTVKASEGFTKAAFSPQTGIAGGCEFQEINLQVQQNDTMNTTGAS